MYLLISSRQNTCNEIGHCGDPGIDAGISRSTASDSPRNDTHRAPLFVHQSPTRVAETRAFATLREPCAKHVVVHWEPVTRELFRAPFVADFGQGHGT